MNLLKNNIHICMFVVAAGLCAFSGVSNAQTKTVTANHARMTMNCDQMNVTIMGSFNSITFNGACGAVTVAGNHNAIAAPSTRAVEVPGNSNSLSLGRVNRVSVLGNHNRIIWSKKASSHVPSVSNLGTGNTVTAAR